MLSGSNWLGPPELVLTTRRPPEWPPDRSEAATKGNAGLQPGYPSGMSVASVARRWAARPPHLAKLDPRAKKARRKFLHAFPDGYRDETYLDWERNYKWNAHQRWESVLAKDAFRTLLDDGRHADV